MAAYRRVYDSRHLQADCQEPGSAAEPCARQSSMGYLYLFTIMCCAGGGLACPASRSGRCGRWCRWTESASCAVTYSDVTTLSVLGPTSWPSRQASTTPGTEREPRGWWSFHWKDNEISVDVRKRWRRKNYKNVKNRFKTWKYCFECV